MFPTNRLDKPYLQYSNTPIYGLVGLRKGVDKHF